MDKILSFLRNKWFQRGLVIAGGLFSAWLLGGLGLTLHEAVQAGGAAVVGLLGSLLVGAGDA